MASAVLNYEIPSVKLQLVVNEPEGYEPVHFDEAEDVVRRLGPLRCAAEENVVALFLNIRNEIVGMQEIARGPISGCEVHPREVFKGAMLCNAHFIILAHNHTSGDVRPTEEDFNLTQHLIEAGKLIGIPVIDHIIVGPKKTFFSFREQTDIWE